MCLLLQAMGKLAEAEPYCREALESRRRVVGDDHRDTLQSINNMGLLLHSMGKRAEAEPYLREALEGQWNAQVYLGILRLRFLHTRWVDICSYRLCRNLGGQGKRTTCRPDDTRDGASLARFGLFHCSTPEVGVGCRHHREPQSAVLDD